ncbi:common central domain of tyrosinase-domain-containing protein [Aspergillus avenaceus]|uniref:tyrosinase n=1 Tax=Aspergillus avenaceus TaxID=36643 RepID=A0A5N6U7M7_ASPAV|nr:common central domain of tyrosinase-domain-containing protein [Aspergillus avenaceus]
MLEKVVRAFKGLQSLPPDNPNSYFNIAGYHGEPFFGEGTTNPNWWGGYCHHGNVLFPTWHRMYVLRLENAMRSVSGCADVSLPFWDECEVDADGKPMSIPEVLTRPTFTLAGDEIPNPLYSYKLQTKLDHEVKGAAHRYSKPLGYQTVRYPQSGLVGNAWDRLATRSQNSDYSDPARCKYELNKNIKNWLSGNVTLTNEGIEETRLPDTASVSGRYRTSLFTENYTTFSNNTSLGDVQIAIFPRPMSLESPHNAMHLAVGGFYQPGVYNASEIAGANGDMGDNETASFDPIFFFHHCFVDYVFWRWQVRHESENKLVIDPNDPGAKLTEGVGNMKPGTTLTVDTELFPFKKDENDYWTSNDITNITSIHTPKGDDFSYSYGKGSLDDIKEPPAKFIGDPLIDVKKITVNRAETRGSFVMRMFAKPPNENVLVELGREPILSRWDVEDCPNCRDKLDVELKVHLTRSMKNIIGDTQENRDAGNEAQYLGAVQSYGQMDFTDNLKEEVHEAASLVQTVSF